MRKISCVMVVLAMVSAVAGAGGPRRASSSRQTPGSTRQPSGYEQVETLRTPQNGDRDAARRHAEEVHAWLMAERVAV